MGVLGAWDAMGIIDDVNVARDGDGNDVGDGGGEDVGVGVCVCVCVRG
jgi:hypothetical protein